MAHLRKIFDPELNTLEAEGITIGDKGVARKAVARYGLNTLCSYLGLFRSYDGKILPGATLKNLADRCRFDEELRSLVLRLQIQIEMYLRSLIVFFHASEHGAMG